MRIPASASASASICFALLHLHFGYQFVSAGSDARCNEDCTSVLQGVYPNSTMMVSYSSHSPLGGVGDVENCEALDEAHFCTLTFQGDIQTPHDRLQSSVSMGACLPVSCTEGTTPKINMDEWVNDLSSGYVSVTSDTVTLHCSAQKATTLTAMGWLTISLLIFLFLLCCFATWSVSRRVTEGKHWALPFDTASNWNRLVTVKDSELRCFDGLRVMSILWIVVAHSIYDNTFIGFDNPREVSDIKQTVPYQLLSSGTFAVDTFFFLSGFLCCHNLLQALVDGKQFSYPKFVAVRVLRLVPAYSIFLLYHITLTPHFASGPFWWKYTVNAAEKCSETWWTNILFINNFYPPEFENQCVGWTWYLACDFQLYIISPIFVFLLHRRPRIGVMASLLACLGVVTTTFTLSFRRSFLATQFEVLNNPYASVIYDKPYTRGAPFFVGLLVAWKYQNRHTDTQELELGQYHRMQNATARHVSSRSVGSASLQTFAVVAMITLFIARHWNVNNEWSTFANAAFISMSPLVFTVLLSLIVWLNVTGQGAWINKILSGQVFTPMARITYSTFIYHGAIILQFVMATDQLVHMSLGTAVQLCCGVAATSYFAGLVSFFLVEAPLTQLAKTIAP